jgi:hypothetical protein
VEGYVYIHPDSFGYKPEHPIFAAEKCDTNGMCTKSDARYSLAALKRGSRAQYWNNAYHFGDRDRPNGSVTFFPILQPVAIIVLTVLSAVLSTIALILVFRPTPDRSIRRREREKASAHDDAAAAKAAAPALLSQ